MAQSKVVSLRARNLAHINRDRGYRWTARDEVLEEIAGMITDSGLSIGDIIERVLDLSGNTIHISYSTIANWQSGKTKRPQNWTVEWVAYALGYERKWRKFR